MVKHDTPEILDSRRREANCAAQYFAEKWKVRSFDFFRISCDKKDQ